MKSAALIIYDFDGTLVDTLYDIADSVNRALNELGFPPFGREAVRPFVGRGVQNLMTRALEGTGYTGIGQAVTLFRKHYARHLVEHTGFYPGVRETVEHFSRLNRRQSILSNKPLDFIEQILVELDFRDPFQILIGGDSVQNKKPDPEGLLKILHDSGITAGETVLVGDSEVDIETGKRAGVRTVGVTYGLGDPAALRASNPDHLIDRMEDLKLLVR
ncbi:MAG: phosphoglycolate phosphatase [Nitrospinae bacterium CG11_big_fil_rev_8_21_14_0_20_56_8]|nr:MAG: phosphoglycolate phosphatase [Nitrospinae bacterium CG11_big_fil_rev_8_21_14_0_20_56_8]